MKAIVVVSDLHIGSFTGLMPQSGILLDDGGRLTASPFQKQLIDWWDDFWGNFVPQTTKGAKEVSVVVNGDIVDGNHHSAVNLIPSVQTQESAAVEILSPIRAKYKNFAIVRGTEAHGGIGEQSTERIGAALQAVEDPLTKQRSHWQYWVESENVVFQFAHHIGTTSSAAYETSAPMRELVASLIEASQWGQRLPNILVRSHRHRFVPVSMPSQDGRIELIVTPGWQLRTPFVERIDRMRMPHIGGVVFLVENGQCRTIEKIYQLPKPRVYQW